MSCYFILLYTLKWKLKRRILESHKVSSSLHIIHKKLSTFQGVTSKNSYMSYGVLNLLKILEVQKVQESIYEHNTYAHFLNDISDRTLPICLFFVFLFFRYFFKCFTFACVHYHLSNRVGWWVIFNLLNKSKIRFKSFDRLKVANSLI